MKIHIIGSGCPVPHKEAFGSAFLVRPEIKQEAIAAIGKTYEGEILFPDELTTVELR